MKANSIADIADRLIQLLIEKWPELEKNTIYGSGLLVELLFSPKLLLRQLLIAGAIQVGVISVSGAGMLVDKLLRKFTKSGSQRQNIEDRMNSSKTYAEWKRHAEVLDSLDGLDKWRLEEGSTMYDVKVLRKRMTDIRAMMNGEDMFNMIFRLRGALARDQFGMQQEGLFTKAAAGTKVIVEEYHQLIISSLNYVCDHHDDEVPTDAKLAFFNETRHSYGRTALLLSGGASLGCYHFGVVKTLFFEGLLPRVISGASAGSLVAAIIGTRTDDEVATLLSAEEPEDYKTLGMRFDFFGMKRRETSQFMYFIPQSFRWFGDALIGYFIDNHSLLRMDTDHLKHVVISNVGLETFQEAFDRTGRIVNITVAPMNKYDPPRLLNYLTAPHICIWSAAVASCAIPGVFDSISLVGKEPSGEFHPENEWTRQGVADDVDKQNSQFSDGSIERDLPMQQISELFNVNHFIVSQVNPHSALLSNLSVYANIWSSTLYGTVVGYLRFLKAQCRDWLKNMIDLVVYNSNAPVWSARRGFTQLLTQDYEGRECDVTIMPWKGAHTAMSAFMVLIKNTSPEEFLEIVQVGARNSWPHISRIRAHCSVEMTLDKCVQRLRKRISLENYNKQFIEDKERGLDRTPSFYTSRSIVNLSGLSVSDPLPRLSGKGLGKSDRRRKATDSKNSIISVDSVTSGSASEAFNIETYEDEDFVTTEHTVPLKEESPVRSLPLQRIVSLETGSKKLKEDVLDDTKEAADPVHKTTNMAHFYYKRSGKSDDSLGSK